MEKQEQISSEHTVSKQSHSATANVVENGKSPETKGLYMQTFGCQMNVHDSRKIASYLADKGYHAVEKAEEADVILVNTCSVREKPEQKVMSAVGVFAPLKQKKPDLVIGIGGCFARQEGEKLIRRSPLIDLVFGPDNIPELPKLINEAHDSHRPVVDVQFDTAENVRFLDIRPSDMAERQAAMVTIMKGCDKYCSFCIVPYVRGRERYRPAPEILREVEELCQNGIKEILLLGQSVTSYRWKDGEDVWELARLLKAVDKVKGLRRLRFTSPYPRDFKEELIDCFDGRVKTLCHHVHLPFQSGSNELLYRMNRRHTREQYFEWVDALRERCPTIALSADVIVGFPGETDQDFEDTMDLIERVQFDQLFSFMYSPRPNTPARRKEQIPEDVKKQRLQRLQMRQAQISLERNKQLEGSLQEVLVEGASRKGGGQLRSRTSSNKVVNFLGPDDLIGQIVNVRITQGNPHSLTGELLSSEE